MSAWCRSGAAVRLLAVLCLTAGCAATQQQPSAVSSTTTYRLLDLIARAVRAELQPIVSKLESRIDALDSRLVQLDSQVGEFRVRLLEICEICQNPQSDQLSSRLDRQQLQLDQLAAKVDEQASQLEILTTLVSGLQESQVAGLVTAQDSRQSQPTVPTGPSDSELDGAANETASPPTQTTEQTVRPDQAEGLTPRPRDCSDLPAGAITGVHVLWLSPNHSVPAYCDMDTAGGNWTVFQRRQDIRPRQDFYLGWDSYKEGFGDLTGEFWWGLEYLSMLTSVPGRQYELRIDLEDFDGNRRYAVYRGFRISSEAEGYGLRVSSYTGDAGDSLSYNNNYKFSTRDRDQDVWFTDSCAEDRQGAWWYGPCGWGNLNGRYLEDGDIDRTGIYWYRWKGYGSLKRTDMKIRPT